MNRLLGDEPAATVFGLLLLVGSTLWGGSCVARFGPPMVDSVMSDGWPTTRGIVRASAVEDFKIGR